MVLVGFLRGLGIFCILYCHFFLGISTIGCKLAHRLSFKTTSSIYYNFVVDVSELYFYIYIVTS